MGGISDQLFNDACDFIVMLGTTGLEYGMSSCFIADVKSGLPIPRGDQWRTLTIPVRG